MMDNFKWCKTARSCHEGGSLNPPREPLARAPRPLKAEFTDLPRRFGLPKLMDSWGASEAPARQFLNNPLSWTLIALIVSGIGLYWDLR